jgi:hypothetical protein
VRAGDTVVELRYRDTWRLEAATELIRRACVLDDAPPPPEPLVWETLE